MTASVEAPPLLSAAEVRARFGEAGLVALTARMRTDATRLRSVASHHGPLDLACELNPRTRRTQALERLSAELETAITTPGTRVVISVSPQEGKTSLVRMAVLRKLQRDPDRRNAIASYGVDLARTSGRAIRQMIDAHGSDAKDPATGAPLPDRLGIKVRGDHAAAADWALDGHEGGAYAIGVGGGLTGRPVDGLFVVDDPVKDQAQADSETYRQRVWDWFTAVGETRLGPDTSVVLIMTRWHEHDLAGRLIENDLDLPEPLREWRIINIPALADGQTPDALADVPGGRTPDGWLVSARGRTPEQWQRIRRRVGERVWASLYQGRPAPLEGGIFKQAWIDANRVDTAPDDLVSTVVAVDPADTGQGDAAGILVGSRAVDGVIYVRADVSDQLSQGEWARRVCMTALRLNADTILQESNLGMGRSIRDAWGVIVRQARALSVAAGSVAAAQAALVAAGDTVAADEEQLHEVAPVAADVLTRPSSGPSRVAAVTPRQSKFVRAHAVTGLYETGRARHVGRLPLLEHEMVTWQPGQKSPNRLDTLAHLLTHLDTAGVPSRVSTPAGSPRVPVRSGALRSGGGGLPTRAGAGGR